MDLLISLGVNSSLAMQFGIFAIVYAVLKYVLFTPYFAAYNERNNRTVGKTELAERYIAETKALEEKFAQTAQEVNERFKAVYDKTRAEALKDYDQLVNDARARSRTLVEDTQKKIRGELEAARTQISKEVGGIAQLINQKLIGKDLTT